MRLISLRGEEINAGYCFLLAGGVTDSRVGHLHVHSKFHTLAIVLNLGLRWRISRRDDGVFYGWG